MTIRYHLTKTWAGNMQWLAEWTATIMAASTETAAKLKQEPEVIVAQAALESGWGRSLVGMHGLFGVKASPGWTGKTIDVPTREVIGGRDVFITDKFRDYDSFADSVADHFRFLVENTRYRPVFDATGPEDYFRRLQQCGYATDPNYANSLVAVWRTVKSLTQHMVKLVDGQAPQPPASSDTIKVTRLLLPVVTGEDVRAVQRVLGITDDGIYGLQTHDAVATYQRSKGLVDDGIVGPKTAEKMGLA